MSPEDFIREWLGTPHEYNGRSPSGIDCYGLVCRYYSSVLGIVLPSFTASDTRRSWVAAFMTKQVESLSIECEPLDNCMAIGGGGRLAHHMGVYYKGRILHVPAKGQVVYQDEHNANALFGHLRYRAYVG